MRSPTRRRLLVGIAAATLAARVGLGHAGAQLIGERSSARGLRNPASASARGGINYHWYALGPDCERDPYGILPNYHKALTGGGSVRALVQTQLADMFAAGMRRLSLGIFFAHGLSSGTLVDAANPLAVQQARQNLAALLFDVRAAGFAEILFRFFPTAAINPSQGDFNPALLPEYWNLIVALRPALVASGLFYRIDLMVEGAPRDSDLPLPEAWKYPANGAWSRAVRALWQNYVASFGRADSIGFSFLSEPNPDRISARVRHMRYVYEGNYPDVFGLDLYGGGASGDEAEVFLRYDDAMAREGFHAGWIIAETYYEDAAAMAALAAVIAVTRRQVFYLTEWPWRRGQICGAGVSVAPPYRYQIPATYGF